MQVLPVSAASLAGDKRLAQQHVEVPTMSIKWNCDYYSKHLRAADKLVGKRSKCPTCGRVQVVPAALTLRPAPAPAQDRNRRPWLGTPFATIVLGAIGAAFLIFGTATDAAKGIQWQFDYDDDGRITSSVDPGGRQT